MGEKIQVLIVEDHPDDAELMVRELRRAGFTPEWVRVETESAYLSALEQNPDVILSDSSLPEFDGLAALDLLRERGLDIPFVLVSGRVGEDLAVDAMKRGAYEYLLKDRLARLGEAVRRAIERQRMRRESAWAVEAMRQNEERYRLISETTSDYAYSLSVDPDGSVTCEWITEPFTRITGLSVAEVNSIGWERLYHTEDLPISERHHQTLLSNQSDSMEIRIVTKNQQACWVRVFGRPIWDEAQCRVVRIYGAAQDITAEKQLEHQLFQSQKMEAVGRLAGGVAHDFNNLLTVIAGYGQILKDQSTADAPGADYLNEIIQAADRAAQLTRQLLAFSRRQVLQLKTVDLNSIVADIEKMLRRLIGEDVEVSCRLDPGLHGVRVDPGQMEQVLLNLAINARDAMPSGGLLTIETANVDLDDAYARLHGSVQAGPHVMLGVSDTGTGMDKATQARIFDPFFTTKEIGKGTGLGLATVYGIVKQSGGNVWVYSEPGAGSTFKVYLPRTQKERGVDKTPALRAPVAQGTETILVVEDEGAVRGLIRRVLARTGYAVLETGDSDEALRMLCPQRAGNIALLITDVIMPKMSGPELAERALALRPGIKILYTSGYTHNAIIQQAVFKPGVTLFEKPFTPDALVRKVREVLDAPA